VNEYTWLFIKKLYSTGPEILFENVNKYFRLNKNYIKLLTIN